MSIGGVDAWGRVNWGTEEMWRMEIGVGNAVRLGTLARVSNSVGASGNEAKDD